MSVYRLNNALWIGLHHKYESGTIGVRHDTSFYLLQRFVCFGGKRYKHGLSAITSHCRVSLRSDVQSAVLDQLTIDDFIKFKRYDCGTHTDRARYSLRDWGVYFFSSIFAHAVLALMPKINRFDDTSKNLLSSFRKRAFFSVASTKYPHLKLFKLYAVPSMTCTGMGRESGGGQ